ncbi:FAD-binding oxidoreductase [Kribbella sandramycini]|uniref:D-amino-acid oxidase n=1 Tax=Kribbella sandramycini TaxID=60450 RepID=A0A7Y4L426_9ACTN|nr:FAD-dependent oxidoreductase [Kribbella sandramycini]MBB6570829.1 D-amino-acid oxidase [Kribbella sandramycini]NOL43960.1 FAD-binding oxidoreductase [Kribbella sandramycini]
MRVIVVGAGVVGLSCAVRLAESGYEVAVFARDLPLETTSAVAGAIWSPYLAGPVERVAGWARASYDEFVKLAEQESSVQLRHGREVYVERTPEPAWADVLPDLTRVASPPVGYADGLAFTAPVVEMPLYLPALVKRLEAAGGTLTRAALSGLPSTADLVVNCAGLGARLTASDSTVTPVRGQVLSVAQCGLTEWLIAGDTVVVPRSNDVIVGGTSEAGDWTLAPDPASSKAILERAATFVPQLRAATVLRERVGLRPVRPEVRCELVADVIHCYGHGGAGVTLSWGCADEVLALANGR